MPAREALIVACAQYSDPVLRQLKAPEADANSLSEVLSNPNIGSFKVTSLIDRPNYEIAAAIEEFFNDRDPEDLLLLYFSGHGIKDADGQFYFAAANTRRSLLRTTAIPGGTVNAVMLSSRSRRQILILDCCYAGAFARGMVAKSDDRVGTIDHFPPTPGSGRIILTASDATQYALEAEQITGSGVRSIFTEVLVNGLRTGEADTNFDGKISLDELFAYAEDRVLQRTPTQKPMKWALGATGAMVIAQNKNPVIQPAELPAYLVSALKENNSSSVRQAAAGDLGAMLGEPNRALALAAELKLKELLEDDSRAIQAIARGFLTGKESQEETGRTPIKIAERLADHEQLAQKEETKKLAGVKQRKRGSAAGPTLLAREPQRQVSPQRLTGGRFLAAILGTNLQGGIGGQKDVTFQPFLMPIEDVFSIPGRGTVVTGRIDRGKVKVGDQVEIVGLRETRKTIVIGVEMLSKELNEVVAGDNVGILLRAISKEDAVRGMVLARPGSISPHTTFRGDVHMLSEKEGGRREPILDGYSAQFYFRTTAVTGVADLPAGVEIVMPGDKVQLQIELIAPVALEVGLRFGIHEDGRTVGAGIISEILE